MEVGNEWMHGPVSTGTTIMAVEYDGGVVIGADSRTSMGVYAVNRFTDKLTHVRDKIYCCRSGLAAHTQALTDIVRYALHLHDIMTGEKPTVEMAALQFRNYRHTNNWLSASIIVAGWDEKKGGQVYALPLSGTLERKPIALDGSGSVYIECFASEFYRPGLNKEECVDLVKKSIKHAIHFDGSSGGVVRIGIINGEGDDMERRVFYNTDNEEAVVSYQKL